jgi:transporter family-2 protein
LHFRYWRSANAETTRAGFAMWSARQAFRAPACKLDPATQSVGGAAKEMCGQGDKMFNFVLPITLAIGAGVSLVVQQALNANLRMALGSAAWSGFTSYLVGTICMALFALATRDPMPPESVTERVPWWGWSGGLFGAVFIGLAILLIPRIGAATFFALLVTGQMLASLAFDHFGLLGVPVHPVSLVRMAGAACLILGVVLIRL